VTDVPLKNVPVGPAVNVQSPAFRIKSTLAHVYPKHLMFVTLAQTVIVVVLKRLFIEPLMLNMNMKLYAQNHVQALPFQKRN
jgi:hypothetical protein